MLSSDLKVYKALANGRMDGASQVVSGVLQNVFPHVTSSQRTAGYKDAYKTFWKCADDADGTLLDPEIYTDAPTLSATDYVVMFAMSQRETIVSITGLLATPPTDGRRKYGSAVLKNNITAGASTFTVTAKNVALTTGNDLIFADGDKIKLTDKATADALTGNEEVLTISGAPSVSGNDITITVSGTIGNSYTANGVTRASSLIKPGDVTCSVGTVTKTSAAGTIDTTTYPIITDNIGTVDEDWTLTFTDATHFTCTGDSLGSVGSGIISADFIPNNAIFTKPYFTLELEAWGGTWAAGNTVTFSTHPAAVGIGQRRTVPAGSASLANNKTTQVLGGEAV